MVTPPSAFNLNKNTLWNKIKENGIGTCGPRAFYGTFREHLQLEDEISKKFNKEATIFLSNGTAGKISNIVSIVKPKHTVFIHSNCHTVISRAVEVSKATIIVYNAVDDLISKLDSKIPFKIIIIEDLLEREGKLFDYSKILKLKECIGFRIILSVKYFYFQNSYDPRVDIIIGSLPYNGGFITTDKNEIDILRLSIDAYVFSASLPVFLVEANIQAVKSMKPYEYTFCKEDVPDPYSPVVTLAVENPYKIQHDFLLSHNLLINVIDNLEYNFIRIVRNLQYSLNTLIQIS